MLATNFLCFSRETKGKSSLYASETWMVLVDSKTDGFQDEISLDTKK